MASSRPEIFRRNKEKESAMGFLRFPSQPQPHSMLLVFKEYNYGKGFTDPNNTGAGMEFFRTLNAGFDTTGRRTSGVSIRSEKSVELPFPKQLSDSTNLSMNSFSRDPLMEKLVNGMEGMLNGGDGGMTLSGLPAAIQQLGISTATKISQAMAGGGGGMGGAISDFTASLGAMGVKDVAGVSKYLLQKVSPMIGEAGNSINLASGQVLNPKETLAFEGVQLRSHSFNWELYPRSAADSDMINNIIYMLKSSILPRVQDFAIGDIANFDRAFLKYPHTCNIYLVGVDRGSWVRYKPAFCTSMEIDYGLGGMGIMQGGKPAGVGISMTFQELTIETAEDYGAESLDPEVAAASKADFNKFLENAEATAAAAQPGSAGGG